MNKPQVMPLSAEQLEQFATKGYIHIPNAIPPALLAQLQTWTDNAEQAAYERLKDGELHRDKIFTVTFFKTYLNRMLHYHQYAGAESLLAMGCPLVTELAESLCGGEVLNTVDLLVFKHGGNLSPIPWHQDLIYPPERFQVACMGLYLDDCGENGGPLMVSPGSHKHKLDMCEMIRNPPPGVETLTCKAGDILIHNPMIAHCSSDRTDAGKRRTLYYEFRSTDHIDYDELWTDPLIAQRQALQSYGRALWSHHYEDGPQPDDADMAAWYQQSVPFNSVNACEDSYKKITL